MLVWLWGVRVSVCEVPVRRVCGNVCKRRKGYEGGVQLVGCGRLLYVFGAHRPVYEAHLVGVVIRETVWYVEIHTRRGDGTDFEIVDYQQWRFGASVDFDSGVGERGGHRTQKCLYRSMCGK